MPVGCALAAGIDVELPTVKTLGPIRSRAPSRTAWSMRRSSTARCDACFGRRPSSGCSTPTGAGARRAPRGRVRLGRRRCAAGSTSTPPRTARSRAGSPRGGRAADQRRHAAACRAAPHRRHRTDRGGPVRRARLLLVPVARRRAPPRDAPRHRSADSARGDPGGVPGRRGRHTSSAPPWTAARRRGSTPRWPRHPSPTSSCSHSVTVPVCSAGAPAGKAATPRPSRCPVRRVSCWTRSSRRARRRW